MSQLVDDFIIQTPLLRPIELDLNIALPSFTLNGQHSTNIEIDLGTTKIMHGVGNLQICFTNYFVQMNAVTKTNGVYLGIASFVMDLGFQNFLIDGGEDTWIDDILVDWNNISEGLQTWFDTVWNDEVQAIINEYMTCAMDHVIGVRYNNFNILLNITFFVLNKICTGVYFCRSCWRKLGFVLHI